MKRRVDGTALAVLVGGGGRRDVIGEERSASQAFCQDQISGSTLCDPLALESCRRLRGRSLLLSNVYATDASSSERRCLWTARIDAAGKPASHDSDARYGNVSCTTRPPTVSFMSSSIARTSSDILHHTGICQIPDQEYGFS